MLKAAEAVELEQAKIGSPRASALAVQEDAPTLSPDPFQDLTERLKELVAAIGFRRRKPLDKSKVRCYNWDRFGNFLNECPNPKKRPKQRARKTIRIAAPRRPPDLGNHNTPSKRRRNKTNTKKNPTVLFHQFLVAASIFTRLLTD